MTRLRRLLLAALLALAACGEPNQLDRGTVVGRDYDDPDQVADQYCVSYDPNGWCRQWFTSYHTEPANWTLQIRGYGDDGKERTEWHDVTEADYDRHPVGSRWGVG